jgi:hypothetical protein
MVTADLLASFGPPATALTDARAKAFKTWLGLRYDRPAIPERLVDLAREVATRCSSRGGRAAAENVHEVLMQFDESDDPPKVALFAIVAADANQDVVRAWLAEASTRINTAFGVVAHIDVATKDQTSISLDREQLRRRSQPTDLARRRPDGSDVAASVRRRRAAGTGAWCVPRGRHSSGLARCHHVTIAPRLR